jgi:hypothetical protein
VEAEEEAAGEAVRQYWAGEKTKAAEEPKAVGKKL